MKNQLRILFTNNTLDYRAGTELFVLDLAKEFHRRGHLPMAYSPNHGVVARALREACIPVISDLNLIGTKPDIIHGQHHVEAMSAMLHFFDVPAIYVCHGWLPWQEAPPVFANIQKYVSVGQQTRESVVTSCGVDCENVEVINNFIDTNNFKMKSKFFKKPRSALIFDNAVTSDSGYVECIKIACNKAGIGKINIIGAGSGNSINNVAEVIREYDIVFALGRSALEAMSVGCSVIVASPFGALGMITPENMSLSLEHFGVSLLDSSKLNVEFIFNEILKYDPYNSFNVAKWIRKNHNLASAADRYENIYCSVINDWRNKLPKPNFHQEILRDASRYIQNLKPILNQENLKKELLSHASLLMKLKNRGIVTDNL